MTIIFFLIACSLIVALGFLIAFLWAAKTGQFEDSYTPAIRMLHDDGTVKKEEKNLDMNSKH